MPAAVRAVCIQLNEEVLLNSAHIKQADGPVRCHIQEVKVAEGRANKQHRWNKKFCWLIILGKIMTKRSHGKPIWLVAACCYQTASVRSNNLKFSWNAPQLIPRKLSNQLNWFYVHSSLTGFTWLNLVWSYVVVERWILQTTSKRHYLN